MPNLVDQELARRSALNSTKAQPSLSFRARMQRLPGELAVKKLDIEQQKVDLQGQRDAFNAAAKQADLERKAAAADLRAQAADARLAVTQGHLDLNDREQKLRDEKAAFDLDKRRQIMDDAEGWKAAAQNLTPGSPAFRKNIIDMAATFPMAIENKDVQEIVKDLKGRHEHIEKIQDAKTRFQENEAAASAAGMVPKTVKAGDITYQVPATPKPVAPMDPAKRLTHLESLRMKSGVDADVVKYLDQEINTVRSQLESPTIPLVAPVGAPAVPTDTTTTSSVEIIERDGKKYQVDHSTKSVTPL